MKRERIYPLAKKCINHKERYGIDGPFYRDGTEFGCTTIYTFLKCPKCIKYMNCQKPYKVRSSEYIKHKNAIEKRGTH